MNNLFFKIITFHQQLNYFIDVIFGKIVMPKINKGLLVIYFVHSDQGITKGNINTHMRKNRVIPVG
jgi:hypothetical protein